MGVALTSWAPPSPSGGSIAVHITGKTSRQGVVRLALFGTEADFNERKRPVLMQTIDPQRVDQVQFELTNVAAGQYVVAVYHDINGNNRLDENLLGIPREPYGFSVEPLTKWRAPRWEEVSFRHTGRPQELKIALRTWHER